MADDQNDDTPEGLGGRPRPCGGGARHRLGCGHHGWGSYDAERPITVTGRIEKVAYGNPHVEIVVEADGKRWDVVLAPVSRMEARGATADVVSLGKNISVFGYPSREKPNEIRAERITIDDRTYEMR